MMQRRHLLQHAAQSAGSIGLLSLAGCASDTGAWLTSTAGDAAQTAATQVLTKPCFMMSPFSW